MKGIHMSEHVSMANEPSIFDDDDKPQGRGVIRIAAVDLEDMEAVSARPTP